MLDQIHCEAKTEIGTGAEFAINAPYPDLSEVDQHVYV
jgi:TPP-dependent pyruvate/acetoin dehydrogenase alpha subunit